MKLDDLRRLSIRGRMKIHFRLQNGMECMVNEQGVAQVPGWRGKPDVNLEQELSAAAEFLFDPLPPATPRKVGRQELLSLTTAGSAAAPEHEEE